MELGGFLRLGSEGAHSTGREHAPAALGSSGLAGEQRKGGDGCGEVGGRAALDLGAVLKPGAVWRRACFVLPTASWQEIACFDGRSAVLLAVQHGFTSPRSGLPPNEGQSRDPAGTEPLSHSPHGRGLALGWPKRDVAEKSMSRSRGCW